MKSLRSRKNINNNSSFLSNHDLLQNFRNKSFKLITRDNSMNNQFKQSSKKVNLIKKKSYEKIEIEQFKTKQKQKDKQNNINLNNHMNSHISVSNILNKNHKLSTHKNSLDNQDINMPSQHNILTIKSKNNTQRSKKQHCNEVNKIIKQLNFVYDQINADQMQLKMIINKNIKKIKQIFDSFILDKSNHNSSHFQPTQRNSIQKTQFYVNKIQNQSKLINKLKIQNDQLKEQLQIDTEMINNLKIKLRKYKQQKQNILTNLQSPEKHHTSLSPFVSPRQFKSINSIMDYNSKGSRYQKIQQKNNVSVYSYQQKNKNLLQQIIVSQTQLINKQSKQFQQQNHELLKLLKSQAQTIEGFILDRNFNLNINQNKQIRNKSYIQSERRQYRQSQIRQKLQSKQKDSFYSESLNKKHNSSERKDSLQMKYNKSNILIRNPANIKNAQFSICLY